MSKLADLLAENHRLQRQADRAAEQTRAAVRIVEARAERAEAECVRLRALLAAHGIEEV